jgi:hypothetical protein
MKSAAPTVHELQAMARRAALRRRRRKRSLSRAAQLQLIDLLSRFAGSALAIVAGVAVFVAVAAGRAYPLRAALWAIMVLGALAMCRRLHSEFRSGRKRAAHPFRWRADYTAAVSVLSAAFGAGAIMLLPSGAPPALAVQTMTLMLTAAFACGVLHAAHGRTAIASSLPCASFVFMAAGRIWGLEAALASAGLATLAGAAALTLLHRFHRQRMQRRFPRTGFARKEAGAALEAVPSPLKAAKR